MPKPLSPAIRFHPDCFNIAQEQLMGRLMANREFLRALVAHGELDALYGYLPARDVSEKDFEKLVHELGATIPVHVIHSHQLHQVAERGALLIDDPLMAIAARLRSFVGHRAYALTAITHTTAEVTAKAELADFITADVQPWDALICTSRAVLSMVKAILTAERARLSERLGATRFPQPLLPVIPLGVDTKRFERSDAWRADWRKRLRIETDELAILYFGRLTRVNKANPLPMLMALGRAALKRPERIHLILAGWWQYPPEEALWREQTAVLCPEVQLHVLDGRGEKVRREIWSAADIFISLVDNIQETFGLAPLEAMAAGLPPVVTDWDGFRDTVRHGVDGMLVPTVMGPPGYGLDIARHYAAGRLNYGGLLAEVARMTVVDIRAAADALVALIADPGLRRRMGLAGQARARDVFDWAHIIPQHQALWQEQQAIRLTSREQPRVPVPNPRHMDSTEAFASWPSKTFSLAQRLRPEPEPPTDDVFCLLNFTMSALPSELGDEEIIRLLDELRRRGEATAGELLEVLEPELRAAGEKTILWLMRAGLVFAVCGYGGEHRLSAAGGLSASLSGAKPRPL
jgi:starch synthase